jgi:hypothetical protein
MIDLEEAQLRTRLALTALKNESIDEAHKSVTAALEYLYECLTPLQEAAQALPPGLMRGDILLNGLALASGAEALTQALKTRDWTELELLAAQAWSGFVLAAKGHARELVGPAMLARADAAERLKMEEHADGIYDVVIKDFEILMDTWIQDEDPPDEDSRIGLECLREALTRRMRRYPDEVERRALLAQTYSVLARRETNA